jgi:trehalose synthase
LTTTKSLDQYANIIGQDMVSDIKDLASRLEGATIAHINSTKVGGGVAEILQNLVPLANSVGLKVHWHVMTGAPEFFSVTKQFHNALQGMSIKLTNTMKKIHQKYNTKYADTLDCKSDVIFIHDPQPAPLIEYLKNDIRKFIWRCHIDLTDANAQYWSYLKQFIRQYDALIFSLDRYVHEDVSHKKYFIVPPSIDPLAEKNKLISPDEVLQTIERFDINPEKPIVTQVARFDYWKDPLGVIDCYRLVKKKIPETQLLLIGGMADDDPEGEEWYSRTLQKAETLSDIYVLTNRDGVADLEVNALQRASSVVVQKSLREGFGLSVAEALWKGVPVVATRAGGIPLQVIDGVSGFLVDDIKETAEKITYLLKRRYLARLLGIEGREHIKRNFLITRHLRDYLNIHLELIEKM